MLTQKLRNLKKNQSNKIPLEVANSIMMNSSESQLEKRPKDFRIDPKSRGKDGHPDTGDIWNNKQDHETFSYINSEVKLRIPSTEYHTLQERIIEFI